MRRYKSVVERLSVGMVAMAVLIRVITQTGLDVRAGDAVKRALRTPEVISFLVYLETGQSITIQTAEDMRQPLRSESADEPANEPTDEPVVDIPQQPVENQPAAPADPEEAPEPLTFTEEDASQIAIGGGCTYEVDVPGLLQAPCELDFGQDGPTVLIVHTHTSEAYTQEAGWEYDENDTARTQDPDYSVVRVGAELTETLESHGISVIHDTTFNDYPSYSGAYNRTLEKIQAWVAQYPSIQMVIDLHRDAASDANGDPVHHTADIDGESTAQIMLVMGTDEGGLSHPGWRSNLSWALKYQAVLNRLYPGLCRDVNLRTERFNQHVTPGSMLIEVGSSGNTLRQALAAARDLGEGLAVLIEGSAAY